MEYEVHMGFIPSILKIQLDNAASALSKPVLPNFGREN